MFIGECGTASADGVTRRGAVCDGGLLLLVRIEERFENAPGFCLGSRDASADAFVSFARTGDACVEVTFCNEVLAGTALRIAEVCQIGAASGPAPIEATTACEEAARTGVDGDACSGSFACLTDRVIAPGEILPVIVWCDAGILRLVPSQTLIFGAP